MLLKAQLPADGGGGSNMPPAARLDTLKAMLDALKPEAVYFYPEHGVRTIIVVFDLKSPSEIPPISEPLFRQNATVEFFPVMNLEDLQAGVQKIRPPA